METNKCLFRSQFECSKIVITFLITAWLLFSLYVYQRNTPIGLLLLIGILFTYSLLAIYQSRYYFYDHQFIRVFTFRPFFRKKIYKYEQIYKIKYLHIPYYGTRKFIVYRNKKQYFQTFNSFVFNRHVKRVEIVDFLLSKNVTMEVRSDFEKKDKEIIDMVKKKYPKNIRL